MKFYATKERLIEGLQRVQTVVSARPNMPILSNVLIEAKEEGLSLTTSDLDVSVRYLVPAQTERVGSTTLPAKKLSSIVKELAEKEVLFETDGSEITTIRSGKTKIRMYGLPSEEFPEFPVFEVLQEFRVMQSQLRAGLKKTSYAISLDESRYVLNGIYFCFRGSTLTMVATDGRRLALYEVDSDSAFANERDFIIPTKSVNELQRLVEGTNEAIIRAGANLISFDFGRVVFVTKRVDGTYPNYRQVIPSQMNYRARLERELFLECVHRVSLMGADGFHAVRLNFSKDLLEIQLNAPDVGEAQETLATAFNGEGMRICFSPEFLMDPLRNMEEEEIDLELIDSLSPGVIKPVNDKLNERFLYVLMPMNPDGVRV